jgi:hypothetical protein
MQSSFGSFEISTLSNAMPENNNSIACCIWERNEWLALTRHQLLFARDLIANLWYYYRRSYDGQIAACRPRLGHRRTNIPDVAYTELEQTPT